MARGVCGVARVSSTLDAAGTGRVGADLLACFHVSRSTVSHMLKQSLPLSANDREFVLAAAARGLRADGRALRADARAAADARACGEPRERGAAARRDARARALRGRARAAQARAPGRGLPDLLGRAPRRAAGAARERATGAAGAGGGGGDDAADLSRLLERVVRESGMLDVEALCVVAGAWVWAVRVDVHVLDNDGNVDDAAALAAVAARPATCAAPR